MSYLSLKLGTKVPNFLNCSPINNQTEKDTDLVVCMHNAIGKF